jgi:photosystem II stability/assembly factor-like uncharacterized protein
MVARQRVFQAIGILSLLIGAAGASGCGGNAQSARDADDARAPARRRQTAAVSLDDDASYRSAVRSSQWAKLATAPTIKGKQDDLFFVTPSLGWSVNGEGHIFRTEDGGGTWTTLVDKPGTFFRSILMLSESRGFAGNIGPDYFPGVTDREPLYETSDRGNTWTPVKTVTGPAPTGICNMQRLDEKRLFAVGRVGGPSFFLSSTDAGATWKSKDLSADLKMLIDVRFRSEADGIIVGMNASERCAILRTKDGGATWKPSFVSQSGALCWKISFPSEKVGYVSIQGDTTGTFAKTTDGGDTWVEKPLVAGPFTGLGAGFITEKMGWIASREKAYRTLDGGETWEVDPSLGRAINRFRFVDKRTAYAIGTAVYKLTVDVGAGATAALSR